MRIEWRLLQLLLQLQQAMLADPTSGCSDATAARPRRGAEVTCVGVGCLCMILF
jgi:hypothetical protein